MDVFACQHCSAAPELVVDGRAQLSIVRHALGCPTLLAQVRARWPDEPTQPPGQAGADTLRAASRIRPLASRHKFAGNQADLVRV
jgi:hypothetical protein